MTPKLWKIRLRRDGGERIVYAQYLGARAEEWLTGAIYKYVAFDRHAGEVTADYEYTRKVGA